MAISMYSASVPVFNRALGNLLNWLDKAEAYAQAKKFDPSVYLSARLAPDMLPFTKQIQIACDAAKFGVARLAGVDAPKNEDNETSLAELRERVRKTLDFINSVPAGKLDGSDTRDLVLPRRDGPVTLNGEFFLKHYALPNFFFHVTTAYALLRHNGVDLGKSDYLGPLK
ncbi:MAG: DUF1993 domain-containing protein [Piscinibacter sp.]|nr:DUF1993 domain-containing protein [Piscinibacter sp.]